MQKFINLLILTLFISLSSCGLKSEPLAEEYRSYAGKWISNDGTWIHIYNNARADLKDGGTSVDGGKITFENDDEFKIGLFGIGKTYQVTKEPYEEDGVWKMELNSFTYLKE